MRVLRSLLIGLIVVSCSSAQEVGDRSVPQDVGVNEVEVADISEPNSAEIERASHGDQKWLAALQAVKEGNDLWRAGEVEQSSASYQRAINLDPSLYSAQFNLGLTFFHSKQYPRAVLAFTEALRLRPESAIAWQSLGFAHYYGKHYHDAVEAFQKAQQLNPTDAVASSNLGFTYLYVNRFQDAIVSFQNALQLDSHLPYAINGLCIAHALAKKPDDAVAACLRAAAGAPDSAVPHYFIGIAYLDLEEAEKALSAFREAVRIEPRTARIYIGLGFSCLRLKRYDEALKHFECARKLHAKKLNGEVNHALLGLGATYARLKDYKKAESVLREAVSLEPDDPTARFNLAIVCLASRNRDCALSQYNRLKMMDHSLARTLFTTIFRGRVVDASRSKNP